jgi:hypothetical protein
MALQVAALQTAVPTRAMALVTARPQAVPAWPGAHRELREQPDELASAREQVASPRPEPAERQVLEWQASRQWARTLWLRAVPAAERAARRA